METIGKLQYLLTGLLGVFATARLAYLALLMMFTLEEKEVYIKKMKNCLIALGAAISIFSIQAIIEYYFK